MTAVKFEPVVITTDPAEVEMVDLFTIDGRAYQVPANPPVGLALLYLREYRDHGEEIANLSLLEACLGAEGFDALMKSPSIKREQVSQVMRLVAQLTLGGLESDPNSASG